MSALFFSDLSPVSALPLTFPSPNPKYDSLHVGFQCQIFSFLQSYGAGAQKVVFCCRTGLRVQVSRLWAVQSFRQENSGLNLFSSDRIFRLPFCFSDD
jgi:hypothetical protein